MKITVLVDNVTKSELKAKHGLSLYIETCKNKILFDLGSDKTFIDNAKLKNIDLSEVDMVIISHGHMDHGGALKYFLDINKKAKIYIQKDAFKSFYSKFMFLKVNIGLDKTYMTHPQVVLVEGDFTISEDLKLFVVNNDESMNVPKNNLLFDENGVDKFSHEQNLVLFESDNVSTIIMGCGHIGLSNIMDKGKEYNPTTVIGGFHLVNPFTKKLISDASLNDVGDILNKFSDINFYTNHCTSQKGYKELRKKSDNIFYFACGDTLDVSS